MTSTTLYFSNSKTLTTDRPFFWSCLYSLNGKNVNFGGQCSAKSQREAYLESIVRAFDTMANKSEILVCVRDNPHGLDQQGWERHIANFDSTATEAIRRMIKFKQLRVMWVVNNSVFNNESIFVDSAAREMLKWSVPAECYWLAVGIKNPKNTNNIIPNCSSMPKREVFDAFTPEESMAFWGREAMKIERELLKSAKKAEVQQRHLHLQQQERELHAKRRAIKKAANDKKYEEKKKMRKLENSKKIK